jgi:hypothetical protein
MVIHHYIQGSEQWFAARRGRPTASRFSEILTPGGKLSKSATAYALELAAECWVQDYRAWSGNKYTDRGEELEPHARAEFIARTGMKVAQVGFVTRDDEVVGCSPDGLILDSSGRYVAGLEIKCVNPRDHFSMIYYDAPAAKYLPQIHGGMAVTGLDTWYFASYFPGLPPFLCVVERDEYTHLLSDALDEFLIMYADIRKVVNERIGEVANSFVVAAVDVTPGSEGDHSEPPTFD